MSYYEGNRDKDKTRKQRLVLKWAKKLKAIDYKGGKCSRCPEDRPWLMEFHHPDDNKEAGVHYLIHQSWDRVKKEIEKCELLCRNCHGDIHFSENFKFYEKEIKEKSENIEGNFTKNVDHAEVLRLHKEGLSQAKIAKQLKCGGSTVCEILKSNGIHTYESRKNIDPFEVKRLREKGLTNPEIGVIFGINRFTVPKILKRLEEQQKE